MKSNGNWSLWTATASFPSEIVLTSGAADEELLGAAVGVVGALLLLSDDASGDEPVVFELEHAVTTMAETVAIVTPAQRPPCQLDFADPTDREANELIKVSLSAGRWVSGVPRSA
jgi:hypothetical protein